MKTQEAGVVMSKKILGLFCLLYVSSVFASIKSQCLNMLTTIQNNTTSACVLLQKNLYNGEFFGQEMSDLILPGESKKIQFQEAESVFKASSELTLSYSCGPGQLTMKMRKDACISGGALSATTVAISNMNASATVSRGSMWHNLPGKIVWILAD